MDAGIYIAIFQLPRTRGITVGKLGRFVFARGLYFYVGTAQRGLSARLDRHARKLKPLRWHIDYLAQYAHMLGAIVVAGPRELECRLAGRLAGRGCSAPVPRFGASDCKCNAHLFHAADWAAAI